MGPSLKSHRSSQELAQMYKHELEVCNSLILNKVQKVRLNRRNKSFWTSWEVWFVENSWKRKEVTPLLFHYFYVTWKANLMKTSNCCGFTKVFSPTCKTTSHIHNHKCSIWTQRNEEWKQHHQYWTMPLVDMNSILWAPQCYLSGHHTETSDLLKYKDHSCSFMLLGNSGLSVSWA